MTDPFRDLHEPIRPAEPDPVFTRHLRARLVRALAEAKRTTPLTSPTARTDVYLTVPLPAPAEIAYRPGDVVHLAIATPDPDNTRAFYGEVLGWRYLPDGRVDGSTPSIGFRKGPSRISCDFAVTDLTAALDRLREAGGEVGEVERHPWGMVVECADDQHTPIRLHQLPTLHMDSVPARGRRLGDPLYVTLEVTDSQRARIFYRAVLGWRVTPGRVDDGWQVQDTAPMIGLSGGHDRTAAVPVWTVRDVAVAVAAVRRRGGSATDPHDEPYGTISEGVDNQGLRLSLVEV